MSSFKHNHPEFGNNSLSVVIPVYNSWVSTERCIVSLNSQRSTPLEIIIVDDGSDLPVPASMAMVFKNDTVIFIRTPHRGVSVARNIGFQHAKGDLVLFVDSDCFLHDFTLGSLVLAASQNLQDAVFQLRISGDASTLIGTAEEIRQSAIQDVLHQPDGHIKWLNTAGFAIRRRFGEHIAPLFDERAKRSQDTLLLAKLMKSGRMPRFVSDGVVIHSPGLSCLQYIGKAYKEHIGSRKAYELIRQMDIKMKVSRQERKMIVRKLYQRSSTLPNGWKAFGLLLARNMIKIIAEKLHPL